MENDLVVKSNSLVESSYSLSVTEFRLLQMVFAEISKFDDSCGFLSGHEFRIHARDYANVFGVDINGAYEALQDATNRLFHRYFTYERIYTKPDKIELVHCRWVNKVAYSKMNGHVVMQLTPDVIDMVGKLKKCFTQYKIKQISNLTSMYALRLYELIIQWNSTKKTPIFEISDFRAKLGVPNDEYTRMFDFKKRVLDLAVNQINENTDINVEYEQHKRGRTIYGFSFSFMVLNEKQYRDPNTVDWINEQSKTKPKRKRITEQEAAKLGRPGEEWPDLLKRIGSEYHVIFDKNSKQQ
ncbi:Replication protein [Wohlfahrtiimonas chitiniclastica SH04]|uniref:Replication protein n=1 Tax=Wohlfahrtiimonas chitiniclastica SH04 TaxID=1261130 RepID=L8XT45_9GAMM|nr:replication initiation protein RepM [Wohlfahrtiimonas chitiniclastica]ELV07203.1 Replication protein [Wohlfahrtiimonas chitiniclastica SH04]